MNKRLAPHQKRIIKPPSDFRAVQLKDSIGLYFTDHGGVELKIIRKLRDGKLVHARGWSNPNEYIVELYTHTFKTWTSRQRECRCGRKKCETEWQSYFTIKKDDVYAVLVDSLLANFKNLTTSAHQAAAIHHWAHVNAQQK